MTVEPSAGPAYQRIAESLRQTVLRSPDAEVRLPTEAELAQQYGVSRQTVRRAYQELVADGLVTRTPGRGSFAARDGSQYLRRFGTVEDLMSLSVDTEMEVLAPLARRIDIEAAGRLGLSSDAVTTVSFRRLHLGVPFCVTDVFLPPDVGSLIADAPEVQRGARSSRTIIGLLDPLLPDPIGGADQTITVALADTRVADAAECDTGEPMLRIDRMYRTVGGDAVELAVSRFVTSLYSYRSSLRRGRT
ncbi:MULTISPECIES: GntR family transcriptional regulator [Mycolicibacterium]|jgi:GntR family transcriptional regulator|uniref:Transcriptional regulator n=2 Tax=Mycolicibacterium TaxID=1866885 RepID=A0A378TKI5_9MYCO|nr:MULTISPECIES: GntR family transcriptional regulator [Mycolicibacterium]ANW66927.1 GntR family transcriptional regulator [Mycobacterium sp. djl-10]MCV7180762.1 GntR family transcriptional regulator [Mycolicibacterium murale]STZ60076.1 transcriptional regulator [Mycolicibacterium tokaiense]BBY85414.1 GntR family transcriptional regulator [Mycolicibacterium tokaiense]GFG56985.1 GntR family transcriptional regulator [Mycolicibacterium murale]